EIWRGNRFVAVLVCDARLVAPARPALLLGPVPARCAAAAALAALGDWRATSALASALRDRVFAVRAAAAHALGVLRDPGALPAPLSAPAKRNRREGAGWRRLHGT